MITRTLACRCETLFHTSSPVARASRADTQVAFDQIGRTRIRYRSMGSHGPTLALSVDPPGVIESYDELANELTRHGLNLLLFEAPGFGFSVPQPGFGFGFQETTEIIRAFLRRRSDGPYVLALPCLLGFTALEIARRDPTLVSHLVFIQQSTKAQAIAWARARDPRGILHTPVLGQLALRLLKSRRTGPWYDSVIAKPELAARLAHNTQWGWAHGASFALASCFQVYLQQVPAAPPPPQRSLFTWGTQDASHAATDFVQATSLAANADRVAFSDAGHSPELEVPDRFAAAVAKFVHGTRC
jgi:pimeloyl-ACP methyl ester carboxylesterase